jgi:hypothetical protein
MQIEQDDARDPTCRITPGSTDPSSVGVSAAEDKLGQVRNLG